MKVRLCFGLACREGRGVGEKTTRRPIEGRVLQDELEGRGFFFLDAALVIIVGAFSFVAEEEEVDRIILGDGKSNAFWVGPRRDFGRWNPCEMVKGKGASSVEMEAESRVEFGMANGVIRVGSREGRDE